MLDEDFLSQIENAPEIAPVKGDVEYTVSILKFEKRIGGDAGSWAGQEYFMVTLMLPDEPTAQDFTYMMKLPANGDGSKEANRERNAIRDFMLAFKLPRTALIDFDDSDPPRSQSAVGCTARAILKLAPDKRNPGQFQNGIKQWVGASKPGAAAAKRGR